MIKQTMIKQTVILFFILILNINFVFAQANINGALRGKVADGNDALIVGANVVLKSADTGKELTTVTDEGGNFSFPLIAPGNYSLTVEKSGYKRNLRENIIITVGESATANVALEVGEVSETVTISSGADVVQTQTTEISQLVNKDRIDNLPLNGKNFQQLINLAPGVGGVIANSGGITNPAISGARPVANSFSIDGVATNDERTTTGLSIGGGAAGLSGGANVAPNLISTEALQEFRVITSNSDALTDAVRAARSMPSQNPVQIVFQVRFMNIIATMRLMRVISLIADRFSIRTEARKIRRFAKIFSAAHSAGASFEINISFLEVTKVFAKN